METTGNRINLTVSELVRVIDALRSEPSFYADGEYFYAKLTKLILEKEHGRSQIFFLSSSEIIEKLGTDVVMSCFFDCSPSTFKELYTAVAVQHKDPFFADMLQNMYIRQAEEKLKNSTSMQSFKNKLFDEEINSWVKSFKRFSIESAKDVQGAGQLIAMKFFNDTYRNMVMNLSLISNYYVSNRERLSDEIKPKMSKFFEIKHKIFKNMRTKNIEEFKQLYEELKTEKIDFCELLYDCMSYAKADTAKKYKEQCTKLESFPTMIDGNGVRFYKANANQNYKMFICTTAEERSRISEEKLHRRDVDTISTSFVTKDSLVSFRDLNEHLTFGYVNINPRLMVYASNVDNYSTFKLGDDFFSGQSFSLLDPDEVARISRESKKYNEINFLQVRDIGRDYLEYKFGKEMIDKIPEMKPDCLFCLNKVTQTEYDYAKKTGIPIFFVKDKSYQFYGMTEEAEPEYDAVL